jgi:rRNA maturation endonuclease Nob1
MTSEVAVVLEHIEKIEKALDLDVLIRRETDNRKGTAKSKSQISCGTCGAMNPPSNKFCSECGSRLNRS